MIVTVTLNASWDLTYHVPELVPGQAHRVQRVDQRAGGKGINVARVLHSLGRPVRVTGLAGGITGGQLRAELASAGIEQALVDPGADARRTVTVVTNGEATLLSEPGPAAVDWTECRAAIKQNLTSSDVVVLAGSLPPGVPDEAYRDLVEDVHAAGALAIVDVGGEPLRLALQAKPDLVKPNATELTATTGSTDPVAGAIELLARGARAVVVSLGHNGMIALDGAGGWRIDAVALRPINPTGAGDAVVAALACGLADNQDWPRLLSEATHLAARAVLCPEAGQLSAHLIEPVPLARPFLGGEDA